MKRKLHRFCLRSKLCLLVSAVLLTSIVYVFNTDDVTHDHSTLLAAGDGLSARTNAAAFTSNEPTITARQPLGPFVRRYYEQRNITDPYDVAESKVPTSPNLQTNGFSTRSGSYGDKTVVKRSGTILAGVPRQYSVYITIGIPTLSREKANYFMPTIESLINQSTPDQQNDTTLVVMLSDRNETFNQQVLQEIKDTYPQYLNDGFLIVISAPDTEHIFQNNDLKRTYNDSMERVRWRSKQNLDYAALMDYCVNQSTYYLQLEDDVTAAPNYIQDIRDFIQENSHKDWAMLEVCPHGFIGKLFRNSDLPKLISILRVFYLEQPCDLLIGTFRSLLLQPKPIVRKKALFFHKGKFSSLHNVVRNVDEPYVSHSGHLILNRVVVLVSLLLQLFVIFAEVT